MKEKHSLVIIILASHHDHARTKSCYVLTLIVEAEEKNLPEIKKMLEAHYQHSEFIQHFINQNYRDTPRNQDIIDDLKKIMKRSNAVYADFYPPFVQCNEYIEAKINELRKTMTIHVCKNDFCLN